MRNENRFFDDMARIFNGIAGNAAGASREAEAAMRARAKDWMQRMDFIEREEFEAVRDMAETARVENIALQKRIDALEQAIAKAKSPPKAVAKATTKVATKATAKTTRKSTAKSASKRPTARKASAKK